MLQINDEGVGFSPRPIRNKRPVNQRPIHYDDSRIIGSLGWQKRTGTDPDSLGYQEKRRIELLFIYRALDNDIWACENSGTLAGSHETEYGVELNPRLLTVLELQHALSVPPPRGLTAYQYLILQKVVEGYGSAEISTMLKGKVTPRAVQRVMADALDTLAAIIYDESSAEVGKRPPLRIVYIGDQDGLND